MEPTTKSKVRALRGSYYGRTDRYRQVGADYVFEQGVPAVSNHQLTWVDTFEGTKNPHWRAQVRSVSDATTPASGRRMSVRVKKHAQVVEFYGRPLVAGEDPRSLWRKTYVSADFPFASSIRINATPFQISTASAENQAISRLYSVLQSFTQSLQAGEDIGEWKQTRNAIRKPLAPMQQLLTRTLDKHSKALSRYRDPRGMAKAMADTYLEWAFGWTPLANSLGEAMVALQNRKEFVRYHPFSAVGKSESNGAVIGGQVGHGGAQCDIVGHASDIASVRYQGVWEARVDIPQRSVRQVLGLNLKNFIPTVWNLIPYSFLIDYFTNVGDFMNITAVPWGGVRWCCKTTRTTCHSKLGVRPVPYTASLSPTVVILSSNVQPGELEATDTRFSRSSVTSLPIPQLEVSWSISDGKKLNILALLASRLTPITKATAKVFGKNPGLVKSVNSELLKVR